MYFFFFNDTATTEIYTLSLHDALPILSDATTGVAVAIASIGVSPKPSKVLGQTTTSAVRYAVTMSVSVRSDSMLQATPRVAASRSRDARSGPFPMMRTGVFGSRRAAARMTAAWFLCGVRCDTVSNPRLRIVGAGVNRSESKQKGTGRQATPNRSCTLAAVCALGTHTSRAWLATNRRRL